MTGPVLYYDADCAFCARSVRLILRFEGQRPKDERVRFAARRGPAGDALHHVRPRVPALDASSKVGREEGGGERCPPAQNHVKLLLHSPPSGSASSRHKNFRG